MSSTAPDCQVWVNGVRLADSAADYESGAPAALSGLAVTWGRDNPSEQPSLASCAFTVADRAGGAGFLDLLQVGWPVRIRASAQWTDTTPRDVVIDPGMATTPAMRVYLDAAHPATVADDPAADALSPPGHALKLTASAAATGVLAYLPPAPFTTRPGSWSDLPYGRTGELWTMSLKIRPGPMQDARYGGQGWTTNGLPDPGVPLWAPVALSGSVSGYQSAGGPYTYPATAQPTRLGFSLSMTPRPWTTAPGTWAAVPAGSWADALSIWLDEMHVYPPAGAARDVLIFAGRITDLAAATGPGGVEVDVIASQWAADLANYAIGDDPWLVQRLDARARRIADFITTFYLGVLIDARPAPLQVSWLDVDDQPVLGLLADLADTGDAVLWPIDAETNPLLWFEDPDTRFSAARLVLVGGVVVIATGRPAGSVVLDSCELIDDLVLVQSVTDVMTRIDLAWLEQTVDDLGLPAPTEHVLTITDDPARALYGERRLSYATQLTNSTDAGTIANRVLARSRAVTWHATGLTWDTKLSNLADDASVSALMTLLDAGHRCGMLLTITGVPDWIPTADAPRAGPAGQDLATYVEGGTYRYRDGRWILELDVSPSGISAGAVHWAGLDPGWQWRQFDPAIDWADLWNVTI